MVVVRASRRPDQCGDQSWYRPILTFAAAFLAWDGVGMPIGSACKFPAPPVDDPVFWSALSNNLVDPDFLTMPSGQRPSSWRRCTAGGASQPACSEPIDLYHGFSPWR